MSRQEVPPKERIRKAEAEERPILTASDPSKPAPPGSEQPGSEQPGPECQGPERPGLQRSVREPSASARLWAKPRGMPHLAVRWNQSLTRRPCPAQPASWRRVSARAFRTAEAQQRRWPARQSLWRSCRHASCPCRRRDRCQMLWVCPPEAVVELRVPLRPRPEVLRQSPTWCLEEPSECPPESPPESPPEHPSGGPSEPPPVRRPWHQRRLALARTQVPAEGTGRRPRPCLCLCPDGFPAPAPAGAPDLPAPPDWRDGRAAGAADRSAAPPLGPGLGLGSEPGPHSQASTRKRGLLWQGRLKDLPASPSVARWAGLRACSPHRLRKSRRSARG